LRNNKAKNDSNDNDNKDEEEEMLQQQLRRARLNEKRVRKLFRDLLLYVLFLCALAVVAYTNGGADSNMYNYQARLKTFLVKSMSDNNNNNNESIGFNEASDKFSIQFIGI
jgi:hypothetical protein